MLDDGNKKYFYFSSEQAARKKEIQAKLGREYKPGLVLVSGKYKQFTEVLNDPDSSRFPDAILVASGFLKKMKYVDETKR